MVAGAFRRLYLALHIRVLKEIVINSKDRMEQRDAGILTPLHQQLHVQKSNVPIIKRQIVILIVKHF